MLRILEENIMYQSFKGGLGGIALAKHGAIWDRPEKEVPA